MKVAKRTSSKKKRPLTQREVGLKYGFRSGLEREVADSLESRGIPYNYEQVTLRYTKPARESKYTPDFVLGKKSGGHLIVETKGRFLTEDRQKHLLVKAQRPDLDIRFVFSNPNTKISKTSKTTYSMWCEKHGFLYAKARIPDEWLEECICESEEA